MEQKTAFGGIELKNPLTASSSPLTESPERIERCAKAGFGSAILKTASPYHRAQAGYGRKVVFIGEDYFADASFQREILTEEEGLTLYRKAQAHKGDMLLIPSVSASSLEAADWLGICRKFQAMGAKLLQLDFFYLGSVICGQNEDFYLDLEQLLSRLRQELDCLIMPKLNFGLDPELACRALAKAKIRQVSLLDSIRFPLPARFGLHPETTSYFGPKQLPLTLLYLQHAVNYELEVCAGGGIAKAADADLLLENGAKLVQTASYVLKNGFSKAPLLLHKEPVPMESHRRTWCDARHYEAEGCERCGFCLGVPK
ncbi:hypothetical protein D7X48_03695 [bacterium D16-50]|nr:hypothetical protein D7X48_03695 [bacterium D16-50]